MHNWDNYYNYGNVGNMLYIAILLVCVSKYILLVDYYLSICRIVFMKIEYSLKQIYPNIFAVIVKDNYDRANLFCRVQEYYESKNEEFNGKAFSIFDYYRWYSKKHGDSFTYASDWSGFNLPLKIAIDCQKKSIVETPYDLTINEILKKISNINKKEKGYIIGVRSLNSVTFRHELCHAFYHSNMDYKVQMDNITETVSKKDFSKMKKCLTDLGYNPKVVKDEIQAYMATEMDAELCRSVRTKKELHNRYKKVFKLFLARY